MSTKKTSPTRKRGAKKTSPTRKRGESWFPRTVDEARIRLDSLVTRTQMDGLERAWRVAAMLAPSFEAQARFDEQAGTFRVLAMQLGIELAPEQRERLEYTSVPGGPAAHALLADVLEMQRHPDIGPLLSAAAVVIRDLLPWTMINRRDRVTRDLEAITVPFLFELHRLAVGETRLTAEGYALSEIVFGGSRPPVDRFKPPADEDAQEEWRRRIDRWRKQVNKDNASVIPTDVLGETFVSGMNFFRELLARK